MISGFKDAELYLLLTLKKQEVEVPIEWLQGWMGGGGSPPPSKHT